MQSGAQGSLALLALDLAFVALAEAFFLADVVLLADAFTFFFLLEDEDFATAFLDEPFAAGFAVFAGVFRFVLFSAAIRKNSQEVGKIGEKAPPIWGGQQSFSCLRRSRSCLPRLSNSTGGRFGVPILALVIEI